MNNTPSTGHHPLLRHLDGHHARVTFEELLFDLVYVFAVTQLSHELLTNLNPTGVIETLILWFAVWLGWQYTCWVTNWFDPETPRIRGMIFTVMLAGLLMASAIPGAFGERGLAFALAYVAIQVDRTTYIVRGLGSDQPLAANYQRMLGWVSISALFWIGGAFVEHEARIVLWAVAIVCEYVSPMFGFPFPGLGRSKTSDWTIEGGHLAERCQLFCIVALGETLLATGATMARAETWKLWTAKEAAVKANGACLAIPLTDVVIDTEGPEIFIATLPTESLSGEWRQLDTTHVLAVATDTNIPTICVCSSVSILKYILTEFNFLR
ncbi:low temperature requirement protein A [Agrobacterium tumefaciens]|uniref:low temperature requirement protein A n=1 Tax=Agrobacterium tumefaciens TaxID=358 RepID=UPI0009C0B3E6